MIQPTDSGAMHSSAQRNAARFLRENYRNSLRNGKVKHLVEAFIQSARIHSQQLTVVKGRESVTYRQLLDASLKCAGSLFEQPNWTPGSRVLISSSWDAG